MKVSALITRLQALQAEHGDLDVYVDAPDEGVRPLNDAQPLSTVSAKLSDYLSEWAQADESERFAEGKGKYAGAFGTRRSAEVGELGEPGIWLGHQRGGDA